MCKTLKCKNPPSKLKQFYEYKYNKYIRHIHTNIDNSDLSSLLSKLNITNNVMNKIYYDVIKNNQYCIKKYNIELTVVNCKNIIGCSKHDLYDYIKKNIDSSSGMTLDNYGTWRIGHKYAFDVTNNKNTMYIIKYFNYNNLLPEWNHHMK